MKIKFLYIVFAVFFLILACDRPPLTEMDTAREAVFRAENDADAVQYAGGTLMRARDALRNMQTEADSKRYDSARNYANEAIAAAERAINDGRTGAQRAAAESSSIVSGLRSEIDETSRNVNGARYSQMVLDYDDLDRRIVNAHNTADLAQANQAAGRYQDAIDNARTVRSDLANVNQLVANAAVVLKK